MKDLVEDVLNKFKGECDYLEIRIEEFSKTSIVIKGKKIELLKEAMELGGCARAYHNDGVGFASFNNIEQAEEYAGKAIKHAKLVGKSKTCLAEVPVVKNDLKPEIKNDPRDVSLTKKLDILMSYNEQILSADPNIPLSSIRYNDSYKIVTFGNSEGTLIRQEKLDIGGSLNAIGSKKGQTQFGHIGFGSSEDFNCIFGHEEKLKEACENVVVLLDAPPIKGGKYTIVADPGLASTFVHEAFGHISEAEKVEENKKLYELMKLGKTFGSPILNIYDSGITKGSRGALVYDEEGVKTEKTDLIKDGILVGRLHTRETAGKLNEKPTGNARAVDYRFAPIPRMRNTCIDAGPNTFDEMLADIKEGVYAVDAFGGQAEEVFTFTAGRGYMIRDGKICEMVKNVTLSGNLFNTLRNIDMIEDKFVQKEGSGGCGKGDRWNFQFPLPIASGSPHIRIKDVVIGGV